MMMDGMHAHLVEAIEKPLQRIRAKGRRQDDDLRGTKIKRLMSWTRAAQVIGVQELVQNLHHPPAQSFNRSKLPHIHARQLLRQRRLIARKETPMSEIIRKALSDEVMFLQRPECVLKNAFIRNRLQCPQQFIEITRPLPSNPQQMLRGIEVKRLLRLPQSGSLRDVLSRGHCS